MNQNQCHSGKSQIEMDSAIIVPSIPQKGKFFVFAGPGTAAIAAGREDIVNQEPGEQQGKQDEKQCQINVKIEYVAFHNVPYFRLSQRKNNHRNTWAGPF
jgi:hypothetical protein